VPLKHKNFVNSADIFALFLVRILGALQHSKNFRFVNQKKIGRSIVLLLRDLGIKFTCWNDNVPLLDQQSAGRWYHCRRRIGRAGQQERIHHDSWTGVAVHRPRKAPCGGYGNVRGRPPDHGCSFTGWSVGWFSASNLS
jgi:hypothetical protein